MPQVREKGTDSAGAEITDSDVHFLRSRLETLSVEGCLFYIDAPTIEILAEDHAPSLLMNRLREILAKRDCVDVELLGAQPATPDEIAGLIDRRGTIENAEAELMAAERAKKAAGEGAGVAVAEPEQALTATEQQAELSVADLPDAGEVLVNNKPLKCLVCKGQQFYHKRAQLHSATKSFFNVEWLGPSTDCYICSECGYVHWFAT